jgi:hypothetical protein
MALLGAATMAFTIYTHDAWGLVSVGSFASLEQARQAFRTLCQDPWYRADGGVRGVELVEESEAGQGQRLDWYSFT